jgi:YggT family protein
MFILGNFIAAIAQIIDILLGIYKWIIIISALLSWVNPDPYNPIVRILHKLTEPVLAPLRRRMPIRNLGMDFSPVIVLLLIIFLQSFLVASMLQLSNYFR